MRTITIVLLSLTVTLHAADKKKKKDDTPVFLNPQTLELDAVGKLTANGQYIVTEIIDDNTMIVTYKNQREHKTQIGSRWVSQGEASVQVPIYDTRVEHISVDLLVDGIPTRGRTTEKAITLGGLYKVTGTKKIDRDTIFILKPFEEPSEQPKVKPQVKESKAIEVVPQKTPEQIKAEWEAKYNAAPVYKLNDGSEIRAQRETDLDDAWLLQDFEGKWRTVKKTDIKEVVKPEAK